MAQDRGGVHEVIVVVGWASATRGRVFWWLAELRPSRRKRCVLVTMEMGIVGVLSHGEAAQRILQLAIEMGVVGLKGNSVGVWHAFQGPS